MKKLLFVSFAFLLLQNLAAQDNVIVNGITYHLLYGQQAVVIKGDYKGKIAIPASFINAGVKYTVSSVGADAFKDCKELTNVTLPVGVQFIQDYAFYGCGNLLTVTIPASVTNIGNAAFRGCKKLSSVAIPASATIGKWVFVNCSAKLIIDPKNKDYSSINGVLYSKDKTDLIHCPANAAGLFTIPATVKYISESAFYECNTITEVKIPKTVQSIGHEAFYNCEKLKSVYINSVNPPDIGLHVFDKDYIEDDYYDYNEFKESLATIYVPSGSIKTYLSVEHWKEYKIAEINSPVPQK